MVRDRYSGRLVAAWPDLDAVAVPSDPAAESLCSYCHKEDATRQCDQCVGDGRGGGSAVKYCFGCFELVHQRDLERRDHTFTVLDTKAIEEGLGKVTSTHAPTHAHTHARTHAHAHMRTRHQHFHRFHSLPCARACSQLCE